MRHSQMDMTLYYAHSSKKQKRAALDNYAQHLVPTPVEKFAGTSAGTANFA